MTQDIDRHIDRDIDIVVVGAGIAGLVAGAHAARAGARVVVLDAHSPGGRARSAEQHGYTLNIGAHALYDGGALRRELTALGVRPTGGAPWLAGAGMRVGDDVHPFVSGAARLATTRLLGARGKAALAGLLGRVGRLDPARLTGRTVDEWLSRLPADAAAIVRALVRLSSYTNAPDLLDAGAAVRQLQIGSQGVTYVDGGWQSIVDALARSVGAAGGEIREDAVVACRRDGERIVVTTATTELAAASVILAAGGPAVAEQLAGAPVPGADRLGPPVEAAALDVATAAAAPVPVLLGVDAPLYWSVHAPVARLAPGSAALGTAMCYLPAGQPRPPRDETRPVLVDHARVAGADVDGATFTRYLHALTVHHAVPTAAGGGLAGRPAVTAYDSNGDDPERAGILVAGDWVGPEGMIGDAAAASGAAAARAAVLAWQRVAAWPPARARG